MESDVGASRGRPSTSVFGSESGGRYGCGRLLYIAYDPGRDVAGWKDSQATEEHVRG